MASGKKQYLISSTAYGMTFTERMKAFKKIWDLQRDNKDAPQFNRGANRMITVGWFENDLTRTDGLLTDEEYDRTNAPVDPIRAYSNHLWSVKGSGDSKELTYLSGSMRMDAASSHYVSLPYDIVFSEEITKTGDGVFPDHHENKLIQWRNSKINENVPSGLFPVYQENLKLLPIENTFKQWYHVITGQTDDEIRKYDDQARDPAVAETYAREMKGSAFARQGAIYFWNLMRSSIANRTRNVKRSRRMAYEDYSSYINAPFSKLETTTLAFGGQCSHFVMNSEYNFYSKLYEDFASALPEKLLPCMLLQQAAETTGGDPDVIYVANDNLTMGGGMKMGDVAVVVRDDPEALSMEYWEKFGGLISMVTRKGWTGRGQTSKPKSDQFNYEKLSQVANIAQTLDVIHATYPAAVATHAKLKNICFSGDYGGVIADTSAKRENYPMYAEVSFAADHFAQFSDYVNEAGLMTDLIDTLIASEFPTLETQTGIASSLRPPRSIHKTVWESEQKLKVTPAAPAAGDSDVTISSAVSILPKRRKTVDVELWLHKVLNNQINTQNMSGRIHAHANGLAGTAAPRALEKQIKSIVALGKIKELVADNTRRYSQILKGEPAYSETVVYQVKKSLAVVARTGERSPGEFIQNFWFANSTDITNINFMDTQVHYGKEYLYEIFAHTLIIGTKYDIGNDDLPLSEVVKSQDELASKLATDSPSLRNMPFSDASYSQAAWYTPSLKIVKTRIATQSVLMYDSAPVAPDVEFVPYKGNNHMLLLVLKGNVGRQQVPSIMINSSLSEYGPSFGDSEAETLRLQRQYQQFEILPGEDLLYESDDRPEYFEVYRTTKQPYSYSDFDGQMLAKVSTKIPSSRATYPFTLIMPKHSTSATMKDIIMPNRKYYYTIRQVDPHGNFSNPTPVFEVEMVDQQGMVYPIIKEHIFKDPIPKTHRKYFNKHIKIAPSPQQVLINTDNMSSAHDAAAPTTAQLGVAKTNIWGKLYKVRITSTTTGKSADLNIDFTQKHKRSLAEMDGPPETDPETGVKEKAKTPSGTTGTHKR